jgi:hypothetical protein
MKKLSIYFHKDFDGLVSAAILTSILQDRYLSFSYHPVDHDLKETWLQQSLDKPAAVLDFFYHPEATYFYDHHTISFIDPDHERQFKETDYKFVNPSFKSTPTILRYIYKDSFDFKPYAEIIKWSDIIDNADYKSPKDVYDSKGDYILLNKLITHYCKHEDKLVEIIPYIMNNQIKDYLQKHKLMLNRIHNEEKKIIDQYKAKVITENNICIYDQSDTDLPLQRFLPYYYYPDIDYVFSIYMKKLNYALVISYNPWKNNNPINLGEMARDFNGYGRKNVAGVLCKTHKEALSVISTISDKLLL